MSTQAVLNRKHLGWSAVKSLAGILAGNLARGQTNTLKMLWKFNSVYNPALQLSDHERPVRYELTPPPEPSARRRTECHVRPPAQWPDHDRPRSRHRIVRERNAGKPRARRRRRQRLRSSSSAKGPRKQPILNDPLASHAIRN